MNITAASGTNARSPTEPMSTITDIAQTKYKEETMKRLGYNFVTVWEYENPPKVNRYFRKEFRPYPHYIVFDFEALLQNLHYQQTKDLTYVSRHVPVSVAIHDSLNEQPTFIEHRDPKTLV